MQSGAQAIRVLHDRGDGSFEDWDAAAAGLKASGHAVACAVGDFDGDGLNDLARRAGRSGAALSQSGQGQVSGRDGRVRPRAAQPALGNYVCGLRPRRRSGLVFDGRSAKPGDAPNVLWRNNGNKTFTEWTEPTGLGGSGKTAAAILTDFNNDHAVDLAVTGDGPSPLIYVNPREGKYPTQPLYEARSCRQPWALRCWITTRTAGWILP